MAAPWLNLAQVPGDWPGQEHAGGRLGERGEAGLDGVKFACGLMCPGSRKPASCEPGSQALFDGNFFLFKASSFIILQAVGF